MPTPEEARRFQLVRELVIQKRGAFEDAGRWLDREFGRRALQLKRVKDIKRRGQLTGVPVEAKPSDWVPSPFVSLIEAVTHLTRIDMTTLNRTERESANKKILLVEWLTTDPDAAEVKPWLTSLQTGDWGGTMGRLWARYQLAEDGQWSDLVSSALGLLSPSITKKLQQPGASKPRRATPTLPPLTPRARALFQLLCELPPEEGRTEKEIIHWFLSQGQHVSIGHVRNGLRSELLPRGLKNKRGVGYFIPVQRRPITRSSSPAKGPGN